MMLANSSVAIELITAAAPPPPPPPTGKKDKDQSAEIYAIDILCFLD